MDSKIYIKCFLIFCAGIVIVSCAQLQVKRTKSGDQTTEGIRYYRPAPYLLVSNDTFENATSTTKSAKTTNAVPVNKYKYSIIYLPDRSEEYAISSRAGIGKVDAKFTLQDGWNFVGMDTTVDSKVNETLTAFGSILGNAATLEEKSMEETLIEGPPSEKLPPRENTIPGLYKFEFNKAGQLVGVTRVISFSKLPGVQDANPNPPEGL